jgi:hypothetical protein
MDIDRCPSCAAAVRRGAEWCTLCYADLRPAPAVADRAPYPKPSVAPTAKASPVYAEPHAAPPAAGANDDLLFAPYEQVLAVAYGGAAPAASQPGHPTGPGLAGDPTRPTPSTTEQDGGWPCSRCQSVNGFDVDVCRSCTAPFGADLASPILTVNRRTMLIRGIAAAAILVLMVGLASFCGTDVSDQPNPSETVAEIVTRPGPAEEPEQTEPAPQDAEPADQADEKDDDADATPAPKGTPGPVEDVDSDDLSG